MKVKDMVYVSMFTAIVAVLGMIPAFYLPLYTVPLTVQTIGVMLAGSILGAKRGGLSLLLIVLLVAVGAQILSGPRGGFGVIIGPTGGFLLSWPVAAFVIGYLVQKNWYTLSFWKLLLINFLGGVLVIYAVGIPYAAFINKVPLWLEATRSLAYIPGDIIKVIIASYIALKVKKTMPFIQAPVESNKTIA
ncbi:biotin transporter BioY [Bacillus horti]|uniref:Biotin transporter n=1 Tax=Caldalkalibacillus horti TaxID=77523 RepID=A0ABT9VW34_9BACI|nr:biotin transporter BioY [Bacillus horti]MDQ0165191.1 biotin transport system substrate-specific component [Bacillus horti]